MYDWLKEATVTDYDSIKAHFERARFPDKGKPLRAWARIFKDGDEYIVKTWSRELCRFLPNNTVVFTSTPEEIRYSAQTIVSAMHRAIPFSAIRVAKGRYRFASNSEVIKNVELKKIEFDAETDRLTAEGLMGDDKYRHRYFSWWSWLHREAPEYFQGITFDLTTGECLNRRPDDRLVPIPAQRLVWLRALRVFKDGIKVRAKMNVFEGISDKIESNNTPISRPDWSHETNKALLFTSLRDGVYPTELLTNIALSHSYGWSWKRPTPKEVSKTIDSICNNNSVELRRQFKVFES